MKRLLAIGIAWLGLLTILGEGSAKAAAPSSPEIHPDGRVTFRYTDHKEVYEAGRIDGSSQWQGFWRITLPILRPTILVALLFRTLDAFRVFDLIFVLTGGGPANSTETLSYLTYIKLFRQFDFGTGSALSVLTFLFVMGISLIYIKVLGAQVKS